MHLYKEYQQKNIYFETHNKLLLLMSLSKTSKRKKDHIDLCLTDKVSYNKSNGFDNYEFEHNAITEVDINKIDLTAKFFSHKIKYPFIISCMTGGTSQSETINQKLAIAASELKIPIGVGSQRQALESSKFHSTYKVIRKNASGIPVLGNIGASEVASSKTIVEDINLLIDLVEADAMVIHLNPLQELLQPEGNCNFNGLLKNIEKITSRIKTPLIAKEVGSGISKNAAKKLLECGVKGIDVAGSGGTSWGAIELLRSGKDDIYLREWGLPTSYCIKSVAELKKVNKFLLIGSGGINNGVDIAKAIALGADLTGSARTILMQVVKNDVDGVINLITEWFETVKKIMYLTGANNLKNFKKTTIKLKEEMI